MTASHLWRIRVRWRRSQLPLPLVASEFAAQMHTTPLLAHITADSLLGSVRRATTAMSGAPRRKAAQRRSAALLEGAGTHRELSLGHAQPVSYDGCLAIATALRQYGVEVVVCICRRRVGRWRKVDALPHSTALQDHLLLQQTVHHQNERVVRREKRWRNRRAREVLVEREFERRAQHAEDAQDRAATPAWHGRCCLELAGEVGLARIGEKHEAGAAHVQHEGPLLRLPRAHVRQIDEERRVESFEKVGAHER
mmetsp:Transcript_10497/g.27237  ORF Transcript_10497/g.27237 Transcript_10497/m.27237 type:complete len:253 (+) Transcript_10497:344-1102(+)